MALCKDTFLQYWLLIWLGMNITYTKFTYNRLDLSFSIPKVFLRSPSYQPMQKFLIKYLMLLIICRSAVSRLKHTNWYVGIRVPRQGLSQCSLSHVSGTVYMWYVYKVKYHPYPSVAGGNTDLIWTTLENYPLFLLIWSLWVTTRLDGYQTKLGGLI